MKTNFRYALDVDGCCLDFATAFIDYCKPLGINLYVEEVWNFFDQDSRSYDVFKNLTDDFWLTLKREEKSLDLRSTPVGYISHRSCSEEVTKQSLLNAGFPDAPVKHVKYTEDKIKIAKEWEIDLFVDDRTSTIVFFEENGINACVLDQLWNKRYNVSRIMTLGELNRSEERRVGKECA